MYTRKHINDLPISILIFLSNSLFLASSLLSLTLLRSQIHTSDLVYKTLISNPLLVAKAVFAASPINNKGDFHSSKMKSIHIFLFVLLSLLVSTAADNVDGLVSLLKEALHSWAQDLDCIFVCNNIAGRYLTLCPEACTR